MSSGDTSSGGSSCRKHPIFRGIRLRKGKWVSEMREPGKTTRIWLGTYRWPEMAAAAYDVAALALKGRRKAVLNFPGHIGLFPAPFSSSPQDIRLAAAAAAEMMRPDEDGRPETERSEGVGNYAEMASEGCDYIDEDELFYMPNLLVQMAEGMLLSPPPRMAPPPSNQWPENFQVDSLWN